MEARDYRRGGLFEDGFLKGIAVSVPLHMAAVLLALAAAWRMPPREVTLPLCTVTLLSMQAQGRGEGVDGAMRKGNGKPAPAGCPALPPPPKPAASVEPEKTGAMQLAKVEKETISHAPVARKIAKRIRKLKPASLSKPPKKQEHIATAENPAPPAVPASTASEARNPSDTSLSDHGEGIGREDGTGTGIGHAAAGTGSGANGSDGQGGHTVGFGGNGEDPSFVTKVLPNYPWMARKLGKEGTVVLLITLCERGRLIAAEVVKSAGSEFDEETLAAIKRSSFRPARRNGKPVRCKAFLPIVFKLQE